MPGATVRYAEGVTHGFLTLRTLDGATIADGDAIQYARGDQVTSRLLLHFKDGSIHDETVVFSQRRQFRVLTDHLIQTRTVFPESDRGLDRRSQRPGRRALTEDGKDKQITEHLALPADLANGMVAKIGRAHV